MSDDQLSKIDEDRHEVHFKAGETLFKNGGPLTHMICLTKGMVKVYLESPHSDKRTIIKIGKPVEMILGPGYLVDNRHHFSVVAVEDTTACFIEVERNKQVMKNNPEYTMAVLQHVNKIIVKQYDKMLSLAHKHTHGKLAESLLYLSKEIYNNDVFDTKLSRQDLADLAAMTKETTIRVLKEFSEEKLIICEQNHFEILNSEKLIQISKFG